MQVKYDDSDAPYPDIKKLGRENRKAVRILLFITIVLSISSLVINMLVTPKMYWSITSIFGMWLIWITAGMPIIRGRITPLMILMDDIVISVFLYVIDITYGNTGWAMSYAVPLVLSGSALIITIIVVAARINWREFYLFELAIVIICITPIILRQFMDFVLWPSIASAAYGVFTFIGIIVLGHKKLTHETKKRLHI